MNSSKKHERALQVGVFKTLPRADRAVAALSELGFGRTDIVVVCPERFREHYDNLDAHPPETANAPDAIAAGGAIGAVLGGLAAAGAMVATGGVGLLLAGALFGGATGGIAGGLIGAMTNHGIEPEGADYYDQAVRRDRILVAVDASAVPSSEEAVREALERAGAEPIEVRKR